VYEILIKVPSLLRVFQDGIFVFYAPIKIRRMKNYFTVIIAALLLSLSLKAAPAEYKICLSSVIASDNYENIEYEYNTNNVMIRSVALLEGGYNIIDSLFYNENNNLTQVRTYQLISNEWRWVSYVDFTYDENGNRATRSNYNDFGSGFSIGGIYYYYYNEENLMTNWDLFMLDELYQRCDLHYNDAGFVIDEIGQAVDFGGVMQNSWRLVYEYDANNNCTKQIQSFWNNFWEMYSYEDYSYDAIGNCTKWDHYVGNAITNRHEYTYSDDYLIEEIVIPDNPERIFPEFVQMKTRLVSDSWSTENDIGQLQYVCDYNYNYSDLTPGEYPSIAVTPDNLSLFLYNMKGDNEGSIFIFNSGVADGIISATIEGDASGVFSFVNANSATISGGEEYELTVSFDTDKAKDVVYEAKVIIATNDPEHPTFEVALTGTLVVGIAQLEAAVKIYPNPASDMLFIEHQQLAVVELWNMLGDRLIKCEADGDSVSLDIAGISSGIYCLRLVDSKGGVIVKKVVKR
jgi:hypothetical protein